LFHSSASISLIELAIRSSIFERALMGIIYLF
jgi:hypothetical protein